MIQKEYLNKTLVNTDKLKTTKKLEHDFVYGLEEKEEVNLLKNFLIAESDLCNPFQEKDYEKILDKNNDMLYYDLSYFPAFQKLLFDLFLINFLSRTKLSFLVDGFTSNDMDNQDFLFGFINYYNFDPIKYPKTTEEPISNFNIKSMPNNSKIISFRQKDVNYLIMEQNIKGLKLLQEGSKDPNLLLRFNYLEIPFNVASDRMKKNKIFLKSSFEKNLERLLNENNDFELYLNLFIPNFVNYVLTLMQTILNSVFASMIVGDFDLRFLKHVNLIPLKSVREESTSIYDTLYKYLDERSKDAFQKVIKSNNLIFENISEKFKILKQLNVVDSVSFNLTYQNEKHKRIQRIDKAYKLDFNLILDLERVFDFLKTDDEIFSEYLKSIKFSGDNSTEHFEHISLFFHLFHSEVIKYLNQKYRVFKMEVKDYKDFARLNIFYILFVYDYYLFYRKAQNLIDKEKALFFKELKTDIYFKM